MKRGILVISHGSRDAAWVELIDESIATVAAQLGVAITNDVPIVSAFLEIVEGRLIQDGIDELEAQGVTDMFVLPLFLSSGSTHVDDIAQGFGQPPVREDREGELGRFRLAPTTRVRFGMPIDDDANIAEVLYANIRELSDTPAQEAILLIGHGSKERVFHGRWRQGLTKLATRLQQRGGFARADIAMLLPNQAGCKLSVLQKKYADLNYIVVPLFLSTGYFTQKVIPTRLAGLQYRYNGKAMLPHAGILQWMYHQLIQWLEEVYDDEN